MFMAGRLKEPYKGIIDCAVKIYHAEGILLFWRGNLARCLYYFPNQTISFALKDKLRSTFNIGNMDSCGVKLTKNILSGGAAGMVSLCYSTLLSMLIPDWLMM